ncbi:MAG TPA: sigma-70 factor domain-containing protein, partial [Burkholderiales bacterium]|nr:sigma-70 factor domain-containing protein [Burkholderiales bacterium]
MQAPLALSVSVPVPMPTGSLEAYIQTVNRFPILSADEERSLARRFQQEGDL